MNIFVSTVTNAHAAYWFHQVETLTATAASLSIVSPSNLEFVSSQIQWQAEHMWEGIDFQHSYQKFLILQTLIPDVLIVLYETNEFGDDDKYANLNMKYMDRLNTLLIHNRLLLDHSNANIRSCSALEDALFYDSEGTDPLDETTILIVESRAKLIANELSHLPPGVREIIVTNAIEVFQFPTLLIH